MPHMTARVVALVLIVTACSGAAVETTTTTTSTTSSTTTTTSLPATTTTTTDDRAHSPVTGLPVDDPDLVDRRILMVKIDNHARAHPHGGIDHADMIIESLVGAGITRLVAVFLESDTAFLGPNRSVRPTDYMLGGGLNFPTIVHSGGQAWVQYISRSRDVHHILPREQRPYNSDDPHAASRLPGRSSPHNLWINTYKVRDLADQRDFTDEPPNLPLWHFAPMPDDADSATEVRMRFSTATTVLWEWDDEEELWLRTSGGTQSTVVDANGHSARVAHPVLIAIEVQQYTESPPGGSGSSVPASRTTGSGNVYVFADGKVVEGTWERPSENDWFTLRDESGNQIPVPPGKAWVSLVPSNLGLTYEP